MNTPISNNTQNVNLATTTTITSSYAGEQVLPFLSAALFQGDTLANKWVNIHPNVKYKAVLPKIDFTDGLLQVDACDFTPTGTLTKGESVITVMDAMINLQFCITPWEHDWLAGSMMAGANNSAFPADFQTYLLNQVAKECSKQVEHIIWKSGFSGTSATTTYTLAGISGFVKLLNDSSSTIKIAGTTLTANNFLGELGKVYAAAYDQTIDSQVIVMNKKSSKLFRQAVLSGATGSNSTNLLSPADFQYLGVPIKVAPGLPDNVMIMYVPGTEITGDLHFATDLLSDFAEVQLIDQRPISGAKNVNVVMRMKMGTAVPYAAQCTLYVS